MSSGIIFDIKRYAINDGPGIRTAVFFKGCPLKCWWCHNPEGQALLPQLMIRANRCKSSMACLDVCPENAITWNNGPITDWKHCDDCGECAEVCYAGARELVGRKVTVEQLMVEIERDIPFYDQSGGGVTFTGGEPIYQIEFLYAALLACKERKLHTVVDTSGYTTWENLNSLLALVDLFLYDVKIMDLNKHIRYTGLGNRQILANLENLSASGSHIVVRIPLVPRVNDDEENLDACASFLAKLPSLDGVEVMPYHEIGVAKYQALGMENKMSTTIPPVREHILEVEEYLGNFHLPVITHDGSAI